MFKKISHCTPGLDPTRKDAFLHGSFFNLDNGILGDGVHGVPPYK